MSELDDLRSAARDFLEDNAPVRANLQEDASVWKRLSAEMGLTALPVEDVPFAWCTTVLEETGRVLLRSPYLSTVVAAAALKALGHEQHLSGLADGAVTAALAFDGLEQVAHASDAGLLLVADQGELIVVETFATEPLEALDLTRPQARVSYTAGVQVGSASHARDLLWCSLAAESVGGAQRILELVVEHLLVRTQFGRPLGSFQALRHQVADLTVLVEAARSSAWYAAQALDTGDDFHVAAPLAKAIASDAYVAVAGKAIQLFGGIGFTWEHDAHLYFKRAWTTSLMYGDNVSLKRLAFDRAGA